MLMLGSDDVVSCGVDCDIELGMSGFTSVVQKHTARNNCNTTMANLSKQSFSTQVHHVHIMYHSMSELGSLVRSHVIVDKKLGVLW
jgi:hypothetical protein